ncbi:MAG: putative replicase protein [Alvestavirus fundivicinum]|uniref:RNA-directed RNA polymerase n=1 Tax=Leviviridae sp. TaxID=2027243 RepID=A0ABY3SSE6_9VIRU|nr:MAG: putative replicase protein [Leviviridae sp.]
MKSYVAFVQSLYDGVLLDIGVKYPECRRGLGRDSLRLSSILEKRGLHFATVVLPDAGKHFDKCLSVGRLDAYNLPCFGGYCRHSVIPRLFKELHLRVFLEDGSLRVDACHDSIRHLRQLFYLFKKIKLECSHEKVLREIEEFFRVDRQCVPDSLGWDGDTIDSEEAKKLSIEDIKRIGIPPATLFELPPDGREDQVEAVRVVSHWLGDVQLVADIVSSMIGVFNPWDHAPRHGPGAVSDARKENSKYEFPYWPHKLDNVFPLADFGFANFSMWADAVNLGELEGRYSLHEPPSRLIAVPKTQKGPRLIAAEPTAHQWCQQMIHDFLRKRVDQTFISKSIHFRDQTFNMKAALQASHTGYHMTVDLSAASDRLSCWLVERIFRRNSSLLRALHSSRTRWISNDIDKKSPSAHRLRKFSCMGSACTFPIQSLVFYVLAVASLLHARGLRPTIKTIGKVSEEVLVFGDDIVIPSDAGECLDLLVAVGLKVNTHKTFRSGRFRESCGMDAYDGTDVTAVYVKARPDKARPNSIISCVETYANLMRAGYRNAAGRIKSTTLKAVPFLKLPCVPMESGIFGWKSPDWKFEESGLRSRFNKSLHRVEYWCHCVKTVATKLPDRSGSRLLQYFVEAPPQDSDWSSGVTSISRTLMRPRWVPTPT